MRATAFLLGFLTGTLAAVSAVAVGAPLVVVFTVGFVVSLWTSQLMLR